MNAKQISLHSSSGENIFHKSNAKMNDLHLAIYEITLEVTDYVVDEMTEKMNGHRMMCVGRNN